jgi:hypothetical protein
VRHMNDSDLPPRVRTKHALAWNMTRKRHRRLLDALEANVDAQAICRGDGSEPLNVLKKVMVHHISRSYGAAHSRSKFGRRSEVREIHNSHVR